MSFERHQDLLNPVVDRRVPVEEPAFGDAAVAPTEERQLAQTISRLLSDEPALLAYLADSIPAWQRTTARIVLIRTLGAERARQLYNAAFGFGTVQFTSNATSPADQTPDVRFGRAQVQALKETLLYLFRDPALAATALPQDLMASAPRAIGEVAMRELRSSKEAAAQAAFSRPPTRNPAGKAIAMAAERRAVTLYRRASAIGSQPNAADPALEEALRRRGQGTPLPAALARDMAGRLGFDFERVRIHTDTVAGEAAKAVNARAFTVGEDIFFARGEFSDSVDGKRLLAHELTHVVQSYQGRATGPSTGAAHISLPGDPLEQEADRVANAVMEPAGGGKNLPGPPPAAAAPSTAAALSPTGAIQRKDQPTSGGTPGTPTAGSGKKLQIQFIAFIPSWLGTPFKNTSAGKTSGLTNQSEFNGEAASVAGTWAPEPGQLSDDYFFSTDNRNFGGGGTHRLMMSATVDSGDIGKLASKGNIFTHNSDDSHRAYADVTGGWINPKVGHVILVSKNAGATGKEKPAVDSAVSSSKFVSSAASYPFKEWTAPNIDISATWTFTKSSPTATTVDLKADGKHNKFPFYEILVNGTSIYSFSSTSTGPGLYNLNSSTAFSASASF